MSPADFSVVTPVFAGDEPVSAWVRFAQAAEAAGFDMLRLTPKPGFDPLSAATVLVSATQRIGLCAAGWTGVGEPYTLARGFAALDHLSGGRAAWEVLPGVPDDMPPYPYRREVDDQNALAAEFVDAAVQLWESWDADAVLFDKAEARFSDPEKIRFIDYDGRYVHARGPLNLPRPPQGRPLIVASAPLPFVDLVLGETLEVPLGAVDRLGRRPARGGLLRERLGLSQ